MVNSRNRKSQSVIELIDRINDKSQLSPQEKFEKVVDIAFRRINNIEKNSWEYRTWKVGSLVAIAEKETKKIRKRELAEVIKNQLKNYKENL